MASSPLDGIRMPNAYRAYYGSIMDGTREVHAAASRAKASLVDTSDHVEPKIALDLAERVAKMHDVDIAEPLRAILKEKNKELAALEMASRIAGGAYMEPDTDMDRRLDLAVRVGLAIVTEGVTIAPLQGISEVAIDANRDGSRYLSVSIAGPMRSAGGTESAVTMLIADHVRRVAGLDAYRADSFDDETGRFVEELRVYERDVGNFQYRVLDEDVIRVISHLPVELAGVDTDLSEVVNHRNMQRIKTNRVRGGALRVLNDGLIGRAKKLLKRIEMYDLEGWEWLGGLKGAVAAGDGEDAASKRMREVIAGRSVLSVSGRPGGFRLRYGRACNTGFASVGMHPALSEILGHTIVAGTQVKTDIPGKGGTVAFVDSIEAPTVLLDGGDVVRVRDAAHAAGLRGSIRRILHLGDILVSYGDFLENNAALVPTGYVEEYWQAELEAAGHAWDGHVPTLPEALEISERWGVPLHPQYLHFWDLIDTDGLGLLRRPRRSDGSSISYDMEAKGVLERLGVPHTVRDGLAILEGDEAAIFRRIVLYGTPRDAPPVRALSLSSGITLRPKFSVSVGVRIGRPEKAAPRSMKPPIHSLFPVGDRGGATRDMIKASRNPDFYTDISLRACSRCGAFAFGMKCNACGGSTALDNQCQYCRAILHEDFCEKCQKRTTTHSYREFPLKQELIRAQERAGHRAREPFKGVKSLIGQDRAAEPLEKGLLRQAHNLTVFKDGTVRYDATNATLTHFCPSWVGADIGRLRDLGYTYDTRGRELRDGDQTVELMVQDVILPKESGPYFVAAARYVDDLLERFYGTERHYNIREPAQLVGHLVVGLAPHTSVGVVARIVGFANTHVCFATPNWHSAKRRDADGDADSLMLLADAFLNFSKNFLSDKIGGLMDAPLLIQPVVIPHEAQPQAHNLEVCKSFPLEFFEETAGSPKAAAIKCVELAKNRLGTEQEFYGYSYTHNTSSLVSSRPRSSYSTLNSMLDKLDMQLRNAEMIDAVDTAEIVTQVISTHLVPDIKGNLRAYAQQKMRCTGCGKDYRRPPLLGACTCGHHLIPTITRASVEKYLRMAQRLVDRYEVGPYQKDRILSLSKEVELIFGRSGGDQTLLTDYSV